MDFDTRVKHAIYQHVARQATLPTVEDVAQSVAAPVSDVRAAYGRLAAHRMLVLEPDRERIRMAPPFSGVPTPHAVEVGGRSYFANCAWDALGIPAALHESGLVRSSCPDCGEALRLEIHADGPGPSSWLFHCAVPAARWWADIVFT